MGPRHGILGDNDISEIGLGVPETQVDPEQLAAEKKLAKFSKSAEYKALKERIEGRIAFYQTYLPSGEPIPITSLAMAERGQAWTVATLVITELKAILETYAAAQETVKNARPEA